MCGLANVDQNAARVPVPAEPARSDKRKQSLYFPEEMLEEIKGQAARLDRSLSWIVQRAWKIARLEIKRLPSVDDLGEEDEQGREGG